jgi:hypothetical protein
LTLALEDGARRYRKALDNLGGSNWPGRSELTIRTTSKRLDEGGITEIEMHLDKHPECKLVIIDVLARVRAPRGIGGEKYRLDYEALAPLQRMANLRQVAIVVVHHANQHAEVADNATLKVLKRLEERELIDLMGETERWSPRVLAGGSACPLVRPSVLILT